MKIAMLTALILSTFVHVPAANAEYPLSFQIADAREILNNSNSEADSKSDSVVYQKPEVKNFNPDYKAWEGVTYIFDNEPSASQGELPYFNYHFE